MYYNRTEYIQNPSDVTSTCEIVTLFLIIIAKEIILFINHTPFYAYYFVVTVVSIQFLM